MLFGGYFASGYIDAREQKKEKEFILHFALIGAILFVVCLIGMELQASLNIVSIDIRANPLFFFERLGIVMLLLTACWFYADYRKTEKSFVLDVGRESLMVYTAHLLVIYGRFWNERSPAFYYGGTFQCNRMYCKYSCSYHDNDWSGNCMGMVEAKSFAACTRDVLYGYGNSDI